MRTVIKGENYTEICYQKGGFESVQYWHLKKNRKREDCGVWEDGEKVCDWNDMLDVRA